MPLDVVGQAAFDELGVVGGEGVGGVLDAGPDELFVGDFHFGVARLQIVDEPAGEDHDGGDRDGRQGRAAFQVVLNPFGLAQRLSDWIAVGGLAVDGNLSSVVTHLAFAAQRLLAVFGFNGEDAFGADQQVVDVEGLAVGLDRDVVDHVVALGVEPLQELAHGFFGGDPPVDQPSLLEGAKGYDDRDGQRKDGNGRHNIGIGRWPPKMLEPSPSRHGGQDGG